MANLFEFSFPWGDVFISGVGWELLVGFVAGTAETLRNADCLTFCVGSGEGFGIIHGNLCTDLTGFRKLSRLLGQM